MGSNLGVERYGIGRVLIKWNGRVYDSIDEKEREFVRRVLMEHGDKVYAILSLLEQLNVEGTWLCREGQLLEKHGILIWWRKFVSGESFVVKVVSQLIWDEIFRLEGSVLTFRYDSIDLVLLALNAFVTDVGGERFVRLD